MSSELDQPAFDSNSFELDGRAIMSRKQTFSGSGSRTDTFISHYRAVERVILAMRERVNKPLSIQAISEIAFLSPYHFNRVFHELIGIPPGHFFSALRMETAKRLLLTTDHTVTDICFQVGFKSLGTFTTRFTHLVGLRPSLLRHLAQNDLISLQLLHDFNAEQRAHGISLDPCVTGRIIAPEAFAGLIFVGLFPTPIPQGQPVACALLSADGLYHIAPVPAGSYYLFAAAFPWSEDPSPYLLYDTAPYVGLSHEPLVVHGDQINYHANVVLRPKLLTDPPILPALPYLLARDSVA